MKIYIKIVYSLSFFALLCSCQNDNKNKIQQLVKENKMLRDSLKSNYKKIAESNFILTPRILYSKVGEPNIITGYICEQKELPKYDVYLTDENYNFSSEDKLQLKNHQGNNFEFEYVPKSTKDNVVRIAAVFKLDTLTLQINGRAYLPMK